MKFLCSFGRPLWLVAALVLTSSLRAQFSASSLTEIPALSGDSSLYFRGMAINDSGSVAGWGRTSTGATASTWSPGSGSVSVDNTGALNSVAAGINSAGTVVGSLSYDESTYTGFYVTHGGSVSLLTNSFGGSNSYALGINSSGQITGQADSSDGTGTTYAFRWTSGGGMVALTNPYPGNGSSGNAINNSGQIAGYITDNNGNNQAVRWEANNSVTVIGNLSGGAYAYANAINNLGHVVGYADNGNGGEDAFLWDGRNTIDLGMFGGSSTEASGVNDSDMVVGGSDLGAFVWANGSMESINQVAAGLLVSGNSAPGFTSLNVATGINNEGQVVGWGTYFDGTSSHSNVGFVLDVSAVPEPSTYALVAGAGVLGWAILRRRVASVTLSA